MARGRGARIAGAIVGGVGGAAIAATLTAAALSVIVARTVIIPPSRRTDDVRILSVDAEAGRIVVSSTSDSRLPGEYSFFFSGDTGHARVGEIIESTPTTVTRRLEGVDRGDLGTAVRGRFSGWYHLDPAGFGFDFSDVEIATPLGAAPAWLVPASESAAAASARWVIQVHGRAVRRGETLRAIGPFRDAGFTSLIVSYRNDGEAPRTDDFRYALGDREWLDVEAAMRYAVANGADELVLMGWSMGGATVLQALTRSAFGGHVVGVVLDSPVVDWIATLDFQGSIRRLPAPVRWGVVQVFRARWTGILTGLAEPLDLDRMDFVRRARELDVPILILHSDDDGFVPSDASRALALARPDIVTLEAFEVARHTKLWNYDRAKWDGAIRRWLATL